jgi:N-methylhydantoinase B
LAGGKEGSNNYAEIHRRDGSVERHNMCTTIPVERDEIIRIYSGTGGGFGDPKKRLKQLVASDLKNGFVTREQARREYEFTPAARA